MGEKKTTSVSKSFLRVEASRIDLLIDTVSELIINQSTILERVKASNVSSDQSVDLALKEYANLTGDLQNRVLSIRAQPVKSLFQRMSRVAREAAQAAGKTLKFETLGDETEIDKTLVERLSEPLTHMIRNSIDHGLEVEKKRFEQGKSAIGTITLSASHESGSVVIRIRDDGAGLNRNKILEKAIERGLVADGTDLTRSEIDQLLFQPGFSTADTVSELSGRGVGMDVVKNAINSLKGSIMIESEPGRGTIFSIFLPLTLAIMEGIILQVGSQRMVLPIVSLVEILSENTQQKLDDTNALLYRGEFIPMISLKDVLNVPRECNTVSATRDLIIIVNLKEGKLVAFEIQGIEDRRQFVIQNLDQNCGNVMGASSAAVLGTGKIALIIDPDDIYLVAKNKTSSTLAEKVFA